MKSIKRASTAAGHIAIRLLLLTLVVKRKFDEAWLHDNKSASVKAIYYIDRPATERQGGIMKTMLRRFKRYRYDSSYIGTST